jgi:hypothetical protein
MYLFGCHSRPFGNIGQLLESLKSKGLLLRKYSYFSSFQQGGKSCLADSNNMGAQTQTIETNPTTLQPDSKPHQSHRGL